VSQPYLSIRNVAKSYGPVQAVEDVSLDISKGEFVSFLGPSGSGKTTTLTMIAGFETPTRGEISLNGKDLSALRPWQRNIGMVFQNYALFPHMSVARNIAFPLKMRGQSNAEIERRVAEVLGLVGLAAFAERHPRELSGGQQQRVAVARGLVFNPDVLLLDEPLGALDKNLREQMQVELKRIHRDSGTTMIYVTHDQTEAMTMSDRIAVFSQGRLEQVGAPLDVYHRPRTRFVGEFVGDSNFFAAHRETSDGPLVIDGIGPIRLPVERLAALGPATAFDVMVRPERLRLVGPETPGELNTADVKIETLVNYGDSVLVLGQINQLPVRLRITGDLPAACREGAIVKAGWAPQDTHVIGRH
jgi:putative spermidine/putrescine transport system ATP-binding protein